MNRYPNVQHPNDGKSRLGGYSHVYFDFCESAYSKHLVKLDEMAQAENEQKEEELDSDAFEQGIKTIIFAALCVEAAINDYGAWQLGDSYFKAHLNNLDVTSKWVVVPRLVCGKQINKEGPGYGHLVSLVKARNELIHNQSRDFKVTDPSLPKLLEKRSREFEASVHKAYRALLLLSLEFDHLIGPIYNPLPTFDKKVAISYKVPPNLVEIHAECKSIAARNRNNS